MPPSKRSRARRPGVPQALTLTRFAEVVCEQLASVQGARAELELFKVRRELKATDPVTVDGEEMSLGEALAALDAQEARVVEAAEARPGTMQLVRKLVAAAHAAEEAQAAIDDDG